MELELGLQLLLQGLPAIAKIFTAIQEERLLHLKQQQAPKRNSPSSEANSSETRDFQMRRFAQEKSLQQQLAAYNRETQLSLATYERETALQLPESHKILDNWPLRLFPSQLLSSHHHEQRIPLRIFLSPPQIQSARLNEVTSALPEIERNLAQSVGEFLSQNYPLSRQERPTEFLAGAWDNHNFHREASIKALFERLKSEPTLILETELVGDYLTFRIAYWGLGQKNYCYQTIFSHLNYRDFLYNCVKQRALKWRKTVNKLLEIGENLETIKTLGEDNCFNLEVLDKEEKWREHGIDTSELALHYRVNNKDFEALSQLLITCHCLVAGWVADAHHLIQYDVSPRLPELLPRLLDNASNPQLVQAVVRTTILGYQDIFQALEYERPLWIPELALKLAQSLACLSDKSWAKEQLDYSLTVWLKQRQIHLDAGANLLEAMQTVLMREDRNYLESLKQYFTTVGDEDAISQVNRLLESIEDLARPQTIPAQQPHSQSIVKVVNSSSIIQLPKSENHSGKLKPKPLLEQIYPTHTLPGYSGKAASIAVSFDGETLASGGDDNTIKLWNLRTGELLHSLMKESGRVLTIALSPDGQTLASSHRTSDRSCINLWHLGTGELLRTLTGHNKWIYSLVISPDGQTLISGGYKIKVWDLKTGKPIQTLAGHKKWVYSLAISPDGQTLVSSGGDKTIKVWNLETGKRLQELPLRTLAGHSDWVRTVAISADGQFLASGSDDSTIKLWHLETGTLIRTLVGHTDWVLSLAISPDGQTLISGSRDNTIKLWHLDTGRLLRTLTEHKKWVYSLAVSPDGHTLVSGSEDKTIKIWQAV